MYAQHGLNLLFPEDALKGAVKIIIFVQYICTFYSTHYLVVMSVQPQLLEMAIYFLFIKASQQQLKVYRTQQGCVWSNHITKENYCILPEQYYRTHTRKFCSLLLCNRQGNFSTVDPQLSKYLCS